MTKSARVPDIEVWRAAQQLIIQFPHDPEMEASQRADRAYQQSDLFNFDLWTRIAGAVKKLLHERQAGEPLN
jgi:hypothetical protein